MINFGQYHSLNNRPSKLVDISTHFIDKVKTDKVDSTDSIYINLKSYIKSLVDTGLVQNEDIFLSPNVNSVNIYGLLYIIDDTFNFCMTENNRFGNPYKLDEVEELIIDNSIKYLNTINLEDENDEDFIDDYPEVDIENVLLIHKGENISRFRLNEYKNKE